MIIQPEMIKINNELRLIKPTTDEWILAFPWYQNKNVMYYSEGTTEKVYNLKEINQMYTYLSKIGELYFIEILKNEKWITIGDVTLSESNLPIVIGYDQYRGMGIGKKVLEVLIDRASQIGYAKIIVPEIYHYNERSKNLFKSLGFNKTSENDKSECYTLIL